MGGNPDIYQCVLIGSVLQHGVAAHVGTGMGVGQGRDAPIRVEVLDGSRILHWLQAVHIHACIDPHQLKIDIPQ